ncbi:MAG: DUF3015 family protein [Nitrospiria bacterium]
MLIKKTMIAVIAAVATAFIPISTVQADVGTETGPGCGLGKVLFEDVPGKNGALQQSVVWLFNLTGLPTFAITFGTSGCTNDGLVMNDQKVTVFASVNLENLKQDMAKGQGEYLESLATLMAIPGEQQDAFFALTQEKYASLYKSERTTSNEMLVALNQELSAHPTLSQAVVR